MTVLPQSLSPETETLAALIENAASIGAVLFDPLRNSRENRYLTDGEIGLIVDALRGHAQQAKEPIGFMAAMDIVEAGFNNWKGKAHNAKWLRHIDGTPIPNDLMVNIAEAISRSVSSTVCESEKGSPVGWGNHLPGRTEP
jgi:hypothetical protein